MAGGEDVERDGKIRHGELITGLTVCSAKPNFAFSRTNLEIVGWDGESIPLVGALRGKGMAVRARTLKGTGKYDMESS